MSTYALLRKQFSRIYTPATVEQLVASSLSSKLSKNSYAILNNMLIPSNGNTSYTQIDHIVISPYGIFCIETKAHRGLILGTKRQKHWNQYLNKRRYSVNNPYHQNFKHTKALQELLGRQLKTPVVSLVTYPLASKVMINNTTHDLSINSTINTIESYTNQLYTIAECQQIIKQIQTANTPESLPAHVSEVTSLLASFKI